MTTSLSTRTAVLALACALAGACGGRAEKADRAAPGASAKAGEPSKAAGAGDYASAPENPCEWIPAADVARIVGPLAGTPTRVRSAESAQSDPRGTGCLYTLVQQPKLGEGTVTVQVVLNQGVSKKTPSAKCATSLPGN